MHSVDRHSDVAIEAKGAMPPPSSVLSIEKCNVNTFKLLVLYDQQLLPYKQISKNLKTRNFLSFCSKAFKSSKMFSIISHLDWKNIY